METHALSMVAGWMRAAVRCVLPADCISCGLALTTDPVSHFCTSCWAAIVPQTKARCSQCDRPFPSSIALTHSPTHRCHHCTVRPPAYAKVWTLYPYLPPLRDAICLFKYQRHLALAKPLAQLMIDALPSSLAIDAILPVPLHPARLREREFNQSLLLADAVGRHLHRPVFSNTLVRPVPSDPQSTLSRKERINNLRQAFAVRTPRQIAGQRLLLIDDVLTTGTTVNECAKVLKKAGACEIVVLTLARTVDAALIPDRLLAAQAARSGDILRL